MSNKSNRPVIDWCKFVLAENLGLLLSGFRNQEEPPSLKEIYNAFMRMLDDIMPGMLDDYYKSTGGCYPNALIVRIISKSPNSSDDLKEILIEVCNDYIGIYRKKKEIEKELAPENQHELEMYKPKSED